MLNTITLYLHRPDMIDLAESFVIYIKNLIEMRHCDYNLLI